MNSGSSAPIGSGVQSAGTLAAISCHHTSRPASQPTLPPVCRTTSTFLTPGHFFSASSALALSGTGLPPRRPSSAVMTMLLSQSDDAVGQAVGREAAEHHRVDGADARAGQHGVGRLGDHRQVDGDAVALLDAELLQHVGHAADFAVQLAVGDLLRFGRIVAFPDDGDLVGALGEVPVDAVGRDVQHAVVEPADADIAGVVDVAHGARTVRLDPVDALAVLAPELDGIRRPRPRTSPCTWRHRHRRAWPSRG